MVRGYITEDTVLELLVDADIPLYDIDSLCDQLLSMGVVIRNDSDAYIDENGDEEYDRSRSDYEQIFADVISIDESLATFIEQICMIQPPQHREWLNLMPQAKGGNEYAYRRLIEMYLRTIVKISLSFHKRLNAPLAETIQEGCVGLIIAVRKYEIGMQDAFLTYFPWWVRQNILRETPFSINPSLYFPVHVKENLLSIWGIVVGHECCECKASKVCPNLISSVSEALKCSTESALTYIGYFREFISIDELRNEDPLALSDYCGLIENFMETRTRAELESTVDEVITTLTPKEKRILQLRFGLKGGDRHTLEEVGAVYEVTRERIRQIEAKAIRKLRHPTRMKILKPFL